MVAAVTVAVINVVLVVVVVVVVAVLSLVVGVAVAVGVVGGGVLTCPTLFSFKMMWKRGEAQGKL